MSAVAMNETGIGQSVERKEDLRFLSGKGQYVDDMRIHGQAYAFIVRSPVAHAVISSIDTRTCESTEGVIEILTAEHFANYGGVPCGWGINNKDGSPMSEPKHPILADGCVRHVGDPVAVVIAESLAIARDAAEKLSINYQTLTPLVTMDKALASDATLIHPDTTSNLCYDWEMGDQAAVDAVFAGAHHVVSLDLVNNRLVANPMEPRAAIGDYSPTSGEYTLYTTSQIPHVVRLLMGAFVLGIPEHKLHVVAPDVGGGFGTKAFHYAEEAIVTVAAHRLGRPVKWTADRSDAFISDAQGRDHESKVELALDANGKFLALRSFTKANLGAYLSTFAAAVPTYLYATLLAGQYTTPLIYCEVKAVFTNTVPVDAYRGAGRPEATYVVERLVDIAAMEMNMDPIEIRRLNFITSFPYETPVALTYDIGNYHATLEKALKVSDYAGFAARKAASRQRGKLRGLGISCYIEACGLAPSNIAGALGARAGLFEVATIRVNPTGSITVLTGSQSTGQGHETTFAQLVSDKLGLSIHDIDIVHGDTGKIPFGMGTYGSRSLAVGGTAVVNAVDKIIAKGKKIAAHLMEASDSDVVFENGEFKVAGTDNAKAFSEIALTAYVPHDFPLETLEPGLEETAFYDPKNFTFPAGTYVCEVEIDEETGVTEVARFHACDDFGRIINPMVVEGQVHGGLTQGIGQALFEHCLYNDIGQLVNGSFMDYCLPRADNLPNYTIDSCVTECTHNPLGVKGCGEAGAIGAPPAVINAVVNALSEFGVRHVDMPATSEKLWRIMHEQTTAV